MSGNWLLIKRDLYERPNHHGYTGIRDEAGRYSKEVADMHMAHYGPNSAVREEDAPEFRAAAFNDLVISHLTKQRDTARTEARKAALEEAAAKLEALADTADKLAEVLSPHSAYRERVEGSAYRKGATAIRALIGTDPTTDRGEG